MPTAGASVVGTDTTTRGDWQGVYGERGWYIPGAGTFDRGPALNLPAQVTDFRVETLDRTPGVLNLDDVPGNLQRPGDPADRAAYWAQQGRYEDGLAVYLTVTGADALKVSVYCPDPYGNGHGELLTVRDAATDAALTPTVRAEGLRDGAYVSFVLAPGSYEIETQQTVTVGGIGAVFFDPAGAPLPIPPPVTQPVAAFLTEDTTTRGTWEGVYGAAGYAVPTTAPASPQVTVRQAARWTWEAATDDARALQSPVGRTASAWYSDTSFSVDVSTPAPRRVALHLVDWDARGRSERIDVFSPAGGLLDSRTVSNFTGGVWETWNISGYVQFRFTRLAGDNAVLSGVFLG